MKQRQPLAATQQMAADALGRVGIFGALDQNVVTALAHDVRLLEVQRGKSIYAQGDVADGVHIIVTGKVKICCRTSEGRDQLLELRGPGDLLGAVSVLVPAVRRATAIAVTDVCTAWVDSETLEGWMTERPQITRRLLRVMAERVQRVNNHLLDVVFDDVPGRVARELLDLAARFGAREGDLMRVTHGLTQTEIAQLVGSTRESVNKALCDFVQRGWITTDGKMTLIHHPELLARRAG